MPATDTSAPAANLTKQRRLHPSWVAAGRRRIVARQLRAKGWTFAQIGRELGVSASTASFDVLDVRPRYGKARSAK